MDADGIVILSGIPGAGKTTIARLVAERFKRSVHLEGDVVGHDFIVSGLVPPEGSPRAEADRQMYLRRRNIVLLANSFAEEGFLCVVDDVVVSPEVLEHYREHLSAHPLRFVQLVPTIDVAESRDAGREKQVFGTWAHLDEVLRSWAEPRPGLWVDSSSMSTEQTVAAILDAWGDAHLP